MSSRTLKENSNSSRTTAATRFVTLKGDYGSGDFVMHRGGILKEVVIAYECWGRLSNNHDNVVLVFGGLSPSAHAFVGGGLGSAEPRSGE